MSNKEKIRQKHLKLLLIIFAILSTVASYAPAVIHEFSLYLSQARAETRQEIVGIPRAYREVMLEIPNQLRDRERFEWPPKTAENYWMTERWVRIRRDMYAKYFGERNHSGSPLEWIGDKVVDAQKDFEAVWKDYDSLARQHYTDEQLHAGKLTFEAQAKLFWVKSIPVDHSGLWWLLPLGHLGAMIGFLPLLLHCVLVSTFEGKRYSLMAELLSFRFQVALLTCYFSPAYYPHGDPKKAVLKAMWATTIFFICVLCGPMVIAAKAVTAKRQRQADEEMLLSPTKVYVPHGPKHLILEYVYHSPSVISAMGVQQAPDVSKGADATGVTTFDDQGWQLFVDGQKHDHDQKNSEDGPKSCPMPVVVSREPELVLAISSPQPKLTIYKEALSKYVGLNGGVFGKEPVIQAGVTAEWDNGVFVDLWTSSSLSQPPSLNNFAYEGDISVGKKFLLNQSNKTTATVAATYVATTPYSSPWGKGDVIQLRASVDHAIKIAGLPVSLYGGVRHFFPVTGSKPDPGTFYQFGGSANLGKGALGVSVNPEVLFDSGAFDFDPAIIARLNLTATWKLRQHIRFQLPIIRASAPITYVSDGRRFQLVIGAGATFIIR